MDPNRIFQPHPEEKMNKKAKRNTICETLRSAYKDIDEESVEQAKLKIRVAITMAKAMDRKLKMYSPKYGKKMYLKKGK